MNLKIYTREEVIRAFEHTKSAMAAARYIGCSYRHFKMYAKSFKTDEGNECLLEYYKNQAGKGISKNGRNKFGDNMVKTRDILSGNVSFSNFTYDQLKNRLIRDKFLPACCGECGYDKKRRDGTQPLILMFKDKNIKNFKIDNLHLMCFNCYYTKGNRLIVNQEYLPGLNTFNPEIDPSELVDYGKITSDFYRDDTPSKYDINDDLYEFVKRKIE